MHFLSDHCRRHGIDDTVHTAVLYYILVRYMTTSKILCGTGHAIDDKLHTAALQNILVCCMSTSKISYTLHTYPSRLHLCLALESMHVCMCVRGRSHEAVEERSQLFNTALSILRCSFVTSLLQLLLLPHNKVFVDKVDRLQHCLCPIVNEKLARQPYRYRRDVAAHETMPGSLEVVLGTYMRPPLRTTDAHVEAIQHACFFFQGMNSKHGYWTSLR